MPKKAPPKKQKTRPVSPAPAVDPMVAELEAAILDNVDEDAAYLVYADHLMAKNDPRGELIVTQLNVDEADGPRKTQLKKAAKALLEKHADYFLGPLATIKGGTFNAVWRYGFIRKLQLEWKDNGLHSNNDGALATLASVLQHPSCQYIIELQVGCIYGDYWDVDTQSVIDMLTTLKRPAAVRLLDLAVARGTHIHSDFCELAPLIAALPKLKRIRLRERRWDEPRSDDLVHEMMIKRSRRTPTEDEVSVGDAS